MAIDISVHKLIDTGEAARLIPGRDGGTVHKNTVGLYCRRGKRGVILESVLAGPRRCTTLEALQTFLAEVDARARRSGQRQQQRSNVSARSRRQAARAVRQAVAELKNAGA
jgi:hypothetical protein